MICARRGCTNEFEARGPKIYCSRRCGWEERNLRVSDRTRQPGMLHPGDVARQLEVCAATLWLWAESGRITAEFLPGTRTRRYRLEEVRRVRAELGAPKNASLRLL
jgi:hypothetical protein